MKTQGITARRALSLSLCGLAALVAAGCERPPVEAVQLGFRGVGQEFVVNPRTLERKVANNVVPAPQPPAAPVPIKASSVYPELKVLGDLSLTEFNRQMAAITEWVAPKEGCAYCHNLQNMNSYEKYTKTVALSMLVMTQNTNASWKDHVGETGVTCYTCHRGRGIPQYVWTSNPGPKQPVGFAGAGQNTSSRTVAFASLPNDPMTAFLDRAATPITVISTNALPTDNMTGVKHAEWTYGLMMHMTESLGVNCTYCHNSRSFYSYEKATRVKAWYAIRHVRSMNTDYIWPLKDVLPVNRKGPLGDPQRIACETCHQGAYKPLYGVSMLKDYPALATPTGISVKPMAAPTGADKGAPAEPKVSDTAVAPKPVM